MSTHPEGGGLGDPHDADRDGMLHRDLTPEQPTTPEPIIGGEETMESDILRAISRAKDLFPKDEGLYSGLYNKDELFLPKFEIEPLPIMPMRERRWEPKADGSDYARDNFGGFGPDSPEYDHDRRLQIIVPDAKAAVTWFKDAKVEPDYSAAHKEFSTRIPEAIHPGVREIEVGFWHNDQTSLVGAKIEPHFSALSVAEVPERNEAGLEIDVHTPAQKMLADHMRTRLETLYPDQVNASKDSRNMVVELGDDMSLHIEASNLPYLNVTVNGSTSFSLNRYGNTKPTPRQLERELHVLKDHFPGIAEAYADFFRQQLPKTQIEVAYKSSQAKGQESDPVNPQRMAQLRQELIVEPREDDFKYIGGLDSDIEKLKQAAMGFAHPEAFREFGVTPPRGILLQGPPGTGKTSLAMAFARDAEAVVLNVKASTIKSAFHGETERNIRGVFQLADELVEEGERVVIFIDEIETLAPARDSMGSSNIDKNVTTELLQGMNVDRKDCVIIAATNVPGLVDPALINNSSRFSQQLEIGLPDTDARTDIIEKLFLKFADKSTNGSQEALFDSGIQVETLAQGSEGLSGADIENAIRKVLFTKAVLLASTGDKPGPATNGEIYQSIKNVAIAKEKTGQNYL